MIRIIRVRGDSLAPGLQHGDYVIASSLPVRFRRLAAGDIVVFDHPVYGTLIKRIRAIGTDGNTVEVAGVHPLSVDSRRFGPIPLAFIQQKVLYHIAKD